MLKAGINIAKQRVRNFSFNNYESRGANIKMKELANSFAQLAAIIMLLVTLAVSTAAISQWAGVDGSSTAAQTLESASPPLSASAR